jgi:hypothetical protein
MLKGSDVLQATWERLPGEKPVYSCAREAYTQMVFVDEEPLRQIGLQGNVERSRKTGGFKWQRRGTAKA